MAVCVSRTGAGNGADALLRVGPVNGTFETYGDASNDFDFQGELVYSQEDPAVGNGSSQNGTWVRGDIQIYYRITYDHGHIVGTREFAELSAANTFTAKQTIDVDGDAFLVDARGYTGSNPATSIRVGAAGQALSVFDESNTHPSFKIGQLSGSVALQFGPGTSSTLDTNLYRSAANVLKTDDTFDANAFRVAGSALSFGHLSGNNTVAKGGTGAATAAAARTNLGVGSMGTKGYWSGSQTDYDALTADSDTLYFVIS